jgi:hypothetical protein
MCGGALRVAPGARRTAPRRRARDGAAPGAEREQAALRTPRTNRVGAEPRVRRAARHEQERGRTGHAARRQQGPRQGLTAPCAGSGAAPGAEPDRAGSGADRAAPGGMPWPCRASRRGWGTARAGRAPGRAAGTGRREMGRRGRGRGDGAMRRRAWRRTGMAATTGMAADGHGDDGADGHGSADGHGGADGHGWAMGGEKEGIGRANCVRGGRNARRGRERDEQGAISLRLTGGPHWVVAAAAGQPPCPHRPGERAAQQAESRGKGPGVGGWAAPREEATSRAGGKSCWATGRQPKTRRGERGKAGHGEAGGAPGGPRRRPKEARAAPRAKRPAGNGGRVFWWFFLFSI